MYLRNLVYIISWMMWMLIDSEHRSVVASTRILKRHINRLIDMIHISWPSSIAATYLNLLAKDLMIFPTSHRSNFSSLTLIWLPIFCTWSKYAELISEWFMHKDSESPRVFVARPVSPDHHLYRIFVKYLTPPLMSLQLILFFKYRIFNRLKDHK